MPNGSLSGVFDLIHLNHVIQTFSPFFPQTSSLWVPFTYRINCTPTLVFYLLESRKKKYARLALRVIRVLYDYKEGLPLKSPLCYATALQIFSLCPEESEIRMQNCTLISAPDGDIPNSLFKVSM